MKMAQPRMRSKGYPTLEITKRKPSPVSCPQHLIQRTPIQLIVDTPYLREGSGKELRRLHDVQQHVHALKTPILSPNGGSTLRSKQKFLIISNFSTSLIARLQPQKLRVSLPRNWLKHQRSHLAELPCLLCCYLRYRHQLSNLHHREKHPLYICAKLKAMSAEDKIQVVKTKRLCTNCLGSGHFKNQCNLTCYWWPLVYWSLHPMVQPLKPEHCWQCIISIFHLRVVSVLSLCLDRVKTSVCLELAECTISLSCSLHSISTLIQPSGRKIDVTTVVVPKVNCDFPKSPVTFQMDWKHLSDLSSRSWFQSTWSHWYTARGRCLCWCPTSWPAEWPPWLTYSLWNWPWLGHLCKTGSTYPSEHSRQLKARVSQKWVHMMQLFSSHCYAALHLFKEMKL